MNCNVTFIKDILTRWMNDNSPIDATPDEPAEGIVITFELEDYGDSETFNVVCVASDDDGLPYFVLGVEMPVNDDAQEEMLSRMLTYFGSRDGITLLEFPEHEKLRAISDQSQVCGEFLDWLRDEKGIHLCTWDYDDGPELAYESTNGLLAEFFGIDLKKINDEKDAMYAALRQEGL
jgi:hypothetical protein